MQPTMQGEIARFGELLFIQLQEKGISVPDLRAMLNASGRDAAERTAEDFRRRIEELLHSTPATS